MFIIKVFNECGIIIANEYYKAENGTQALQMFLKNNSGFNIMVGDTIKIEEE